MPNSPQLTYYVSQDDKQRIEQYANEHDMSVSELSRRVVLDRIENDQLDQVATESQVEQRLNELVKLSTERINENYQSANQKIEALGTSFIKDAVYSVAIMQLLAEERSHQQVTAALKDGARIVSENWDLPHDWHQNALASAYQELDLDPDSDTRRNDTDSKASQRDVESIKEDIGIDWLSE